MEGRNKDTRALVDELLESGRFVNLGSEKDFKLRVKEHHEKAENEENDSDEEFSLEPGF